MQFLKDRIFCGLIKIVAAVLGHIPVPSGNDLLRRPAHQPHIGRIDIRTGANRRKIVGVNEGFEVMLHNISLYGMGFYLPDRYTGPIITPVKTTVQTHLASATKLSMIADASVDLVVTSPPYPMIAMWDEVFSSQDPSIRSALEDGQGKVAFERMHRILDAVWTEVDRVLKPGGMACINIGDATRTIQGVFRLYPNHARILTLLMDLGFATLPDILWRKPSNAPNKFMGSGMLPTGAYVTYEHEYILIVRKGTRRVFATEKEKQRRQESAFFWEERNIWFSDIWSNITGIKQDARQEANLRRSGAFPFELAYRLINMYSIKQDTVLDPFAGTGTTILAAMASGRQAIGVESDPQFFDIICALVETNPEEVNQYISSRLDRHRAFVDQRIRDGKPIKYFNKLYGFPVVTGQEQALFFNEIMVIEMAGKGIFKVKYSDTPIDGIKFSR